MNQDSQAAILINDLDNMVHRIEALPAHPRYTDALTAVQSARQALIQGRAGLHESELAKRFADARKRAQS